MVRNTAFIIGLFIITPYGDRRFGSITV